MNNGVVELLGYKRLVAVFCLIFKKQKGSNRQLLLGSNIFDTAYYNYKLGTNFDAGSAVNQYLGRGLKDGTQVFRYFDARYYVGSNNDVRLSEIDPLIHFISNGGKELRNCHADFKLDKFINDYGSNIACDSNYLELFIDYVKSGKIKEADYFNHSGNLMPTRDDADILREPGYFDIDFYEASYPDVKKSGMDPVEHYLYFGVKEDRNPSLFFDTRYYLETNADVAASGQNPFVHFISHGKAEGRRPQSEDSVVLGELRRGSLPADVKFAFQVHLYYAEVIHELVPLLSKLSLNFDIFVSISTEQDRRYVNTILKKTLRNVGRIEVHTVQNIGRDLAPLFVEFSPIWKEYDYVCHLHSKKSPHTVFGERWRAHLFDQLIGSDAICNSVLNYLHENKDIGVFYPENFYEIKKFVGWCGNVERTKKLLSEIGLDDHCLNDSVEFPAGSMCWLRTEAFKPLVERKLCLDDFVAEDGSVEGTLAHTLERCLTVIPLSQGYRSVKYYAAPQQPKMLADKWHFPCSLVEKVGARWMRDTPEIAVNRPRKLLPQLEKYNPDSLNIHWIIPDFGLGAGGHMTIFRMIYFLEKFGHRQTIWIQNPGNYISGEYAKKTIQKEYQPIGENVCVRFLPNEVDNISGDIVIATDCWTVFPAVTMRRFKERFYFIQDWEPMFHPMGDTWLVANETYKMGLNALCAGAWLHQKANEAGMWARKWDLASDQKYYYPEKSCVKFRTLLGGLRKPRIVYYSRAYTPRRAVRLGVAALKELHKRGVDFHVDFFGEENLDFGVEFSHQYHGLLKPSKLGDLYRAADIGMVFSATNYSLIPLEMMACGLPVIELDVESTRIAFPENSVCFAPPNPVGISDKLRLLIGDSELRSRLASAGQEFISSLSWEGSAKNIESALFEKLDECGYKPLDTKKMFMEGNCPYKASVIIPTFNGGELFECVLEAVITQECPWDFEVLVVDSGSTDQTLDIVRKFEGRGVRLHQISNKEFQHGKTRNLAIELTSGEFIAVLTQDATPTNAHWLRNLVAAFDEGGRVAGVFGRHLAYPEHSSFIKRDLQNMFERFDRFPSVYSWSRNLPGNTQKGSLEWQMLVQFYSDNNSCMRRSVWEQIPYPNVDWGEDQVWAWQVIQLGLEKAYASDAVVYHSHDHSYEEQFNVSRVEAKFFNEKFGINLLDVGGVITQVFNAEIDYAKNMGISKPELNKHLKIVEAIFNGRTEESRDEKNTVLN